VAEFASPLRGAFTAFEYLVHFTPKLANPSGTVIN
jgi:hypothetical protein